MKEPRRKQIEELVNSRQYISMQELCDIFHVSINTIRSDVACLVDEGLINKVYGGISSKKQAKAVPLFESRMSQSVEQKRAIARQAEKLIECSDVIFLDAGTTTMGILEFLPPEKEITVVTHSIPVILKALNMQNVKLIVLPGPHNQRSNSLLDGSTPEYLARYQLTKAFMGVSSLVPDGTLGVSSYSEYVLKQAAIKHSIKHYLLVDSSKLGSPGLLSYGTIDQMDYIITDFGMPASFITLCRNHGVTIEQVSEK